MNPNLKLPTEKIAQFCSKWKIVALELFGSSLRDDFHSNSDVDLLVTFHPTAEWGLLDHFQMEEELQGILGRRVDLLTRRSVEQCRNRYRRREILRKTETVYVSG
ncbi:MAG: nucleotidyltransferase family protein [Candidatus Electryoneaceae bacterium]|nr:nucleotidyltransferase family protein [Candidatus Electryoneaceae bacterium]